LLKKDFFYNLPEELIAQKPIENRENSRLMVLDKNTGKTEDRIFHDIIDYLKEGDCLVLNNTKVIPARLIGCKEGTGGAMEFLLLNKKSLTEWEVMVRPGKRAKKGARFIFGDELAAEVIEIMESGNRMVRFEYEGVFEEILDRLGEMPLPPYITKKLEDKNRYQTVYAKIPGSAAAPTAGLHFTPELIERIKAKGVNIAYVTLHVGIGTFRPVKTENILEHKMHSEFYMLPQETADAVKEAKQNGRKVISVGTTATRVLETVGIKYGELKEDSGWTDIFIYPGYEFKVTDSLITNFHLPESTLIMLVSALAGRENVLKAYNEAVRKKYRFFSLGDAMFIH